MGDNAPVGQSVPVQSQVVRLRLMGVNAPVGQSVAVRSQVVRLCLMGDNAPVGQSVAAPSQVVTAVDANCKTHTWFSRASMIRSMFHSLI